MDMGDGKQTSRGTRAKGTQGQGWPPWITVIPPPPGRLAHTFPLPFNLELFALSLHTKISSSGWKWNMTPQCEGKGLKSINTMEGQTGGRGIA